MKKIEKGREPKSLTEQRAKRGDFDGLQKDELREQLLNEQGFICCYCMRRIPQTLSLEQIEKNYPSSKIEHVLPQENPKYSDQVLNYNNLLIACNGNHGQSPRIQTCDSSKGKREISFNPSDKNRDIENYIRYNGEGRIFSDTSLIEYELNKILNLNTDDLKRVRAEIFRNINNRINQEGKIRQGKDIQKRFFESEKKRLLTKQGGKFDEYCMVGVYLLNKKLAKYS
jgi:uncharacterized protein (TIGR02646 family)